jgi:iron complex transport system ATP-binding protein
MMPPTETAPPAASPHTLEARHLDFTYGNGPLAVRDVSLIATPGTMTAIIGSNGSGKSTLIRMLAGLLKPRAGTIHLGGIPFESWQPRLRAREIAYMPQATATAFPFSVMDMVLSGRTPHALRFRLESPRDREIALESLDAVGAAHLAARSFVGLSGGERQMVILARALAQQPHLLLLDEPSSSLDLKHRATLIRTLVRLRETKNLGVVMVTHDLQLAGAFHQILALRTGEVAASGVSEEVLREPLLRDVYGDPHVRAQQIDGQTHVWVDL